MVTDFKENRNSDLGAFGIFNAQRSGAPLTDDETAYLILGIWRQQHDDGQPCEVARYARTPEIAIRVQALVAAERVI